MLKADYSITADRIDCVSALPVEAGYGVILVTPAPAGNGLLDGGDSLPPTVAVPTGQALTGLKFVGVARQTVKALNTAVSSRNDINRTEQVVGEPFQIVTDGWLRTNAVTGTPAAEADAYLQTDGTFGATQINSLPAVGKFKGPKDGDGFIRIAVKVA